jgi:succinate-semialdehyde dehydrogenase/glutarate-semialdehyde dehydrogenase
MRTTSSSVERHSRGELFYAPTVLADVTQAMRIAREETFGPVAPLFRFETGIMTNYAVL